MKSFVILFLYLTVFQMIFVKSRVSLENLENGTTDRQNIECDEKRQEVSTNETNTGEGTVDKSVETEVDNNKAVTEGSKAVTDGSVLKSSTAKTGVVIVPEGRTVITVRANCPKGCRGDGKGNCKAEY